MSVYLTSALISDFSYSMISVLRWIRPPLSPPASDIWVDVDPRLLSSGLVVPVSVYLSSALYDLRLPAKPKMGFLNIISATHGPGVGSVSPVPTPTTSPRLQSFPSQQLTMVPSLSQPQGENPEFLTEQIDPKWCVPSLFGDRDCAENNLRNTASSPPPKNTSTVQ